MRKVTYLLACAFLLAGSSMAGSTNGNLPGVGTFAYNGPVLAGAASPALVIAANPK
jgi:hypothetical protein